MYTIGFSVTHVASGLGVMCRSKHLLGKTPAVFGSSAKRFRSEGGRVCEKEIRAEARVETKKCLDGRNEAEVSLEGSPERGGRDSERTRGAQAQAVWPRFFEN